MYEESQGTITIATTVLNTIARLTTLGVPEVVGAAPALMGKALVSKGDQQQFITIKGVDPALGVRVGDHVRHGAVERYVAGAVEAERGREAVLVVELEDRIAVIDGALAQTAREIELLDLWQRRVDLMEQLYQVRVSRAAYVGF